MDNCDKSSRNYSQCFTAAQDDYDNKVKAYENCAEMRRAQIRDTDQIKKSAVRVTGLLDLIHADGTKEEISDSGLLHRDAHRGRRQVLAARLEPARRREVRERLADTFPSGERRDREDRAERDGDPRRGVEPGPGSGSSHRRSKAVKARVPRI